jgi:hypothetical protein
MAAGIIITKYQKLRIFHQYGRGIKTTVIAINAHPA